MLDLIKIRRDLHQIPETGWKEFQTSDYVYGVIKELTKNRSDIEITRHETGIVVYIPGTVGEKTVGWRSDMDGLSVKEETGLPFASTHEGVAHACGHDIHMAVTLGLMECLLSRKQRNNFLILFQPAEEAPGGAKIMFDEVIAPKYKVDEFYALHDTPEYEPGIISTKTGALFAGGAGVSVEFVGRSGHGAMPHLTFDPIVAVSNFVVEVQTLVSRNLNPREGDVLTFGTIEGGTVANAVAESAKVTCSLRISNPDSIGYARKRINEIAEGVGVSSGCKVNYEFIEVGNGSYVVVMNDEKLTNQFIDFMNRHHPESFQVTKDITMTSEDFGYILTKVPGFMFWLGVGGKEKGLSLHNGRFNPDESAIATAVEITGEYLAQL